jgi:hypothetical protein
MLDGVTCSACDLMTQEPLPDFAEEVSNLSATAAATTDIASQCRAVLVSSGLCTSCLLWYDMTLRLLALACGHTEDVSPTPTMRNGRVFESCCVLAER